MFRRFQSSSLKRHVIHPLTLENLNALAMGYAMISVKS
jgi:hypothetical protein